MALSSLFKKLIFAKQIEYIDGRFFLMSHVPGIILPIKIFVELTKKMYKHKEDDVLKSIAYEYGLEAGKRYKNVAARTMLEFISFIEEVVETIGFGRLVIKKATEKEMIVTINPSPLAENWLKIEGKSNRPICLYSLGLLEGSFEGYTSKKWKGEEIKCVAMGDPSCEFHIKTK